MRRLILLISLQISSGHCFSQNVSAVRYNLSINIDFNKKIMTTEGNLAFKVLQEEPLDSIKLFFHETMEDLEIFSFTNKNRKKLKFKKKEDSGGHFAYTVYLSRKFANNEEVKLGFSYSGGQKTGRQFYFASEMLFAGGVATAWYPIVINVDPKLRSGTLMTGTGKISITADKPFYPLICEGTLLKQKTENVFTYDISSPTFFTLCVAKYKEYKTPGSFPLTAYLINERKGINNYLNKCLSIINYLSSLFGVYPYSKFSIIELTDEVSQKLRIGGGSIATGILMPSSSLDSKFNLALYGHELSHQWWGNKVKIKGNKGGGMLDEAMAQFGALMTVEKFDSLNGAELFRRKGYPGYITSQSGFGYLNYITNSLDVPLANLTPATSHKIGDSKGFLVYDILSRTIGRDKFLKALQTIVINYTLISWDEFLKEINKASGEDLSWFYQQWFNQTGAPEWSVKWHQVDNLLSIQISQTDPFYRIDSLEMNVISSDGKIVQQVISIKEKQAEIKVGVNFQVKQVIIDPYFKVLHWDQAYKEEINQSKIITLFQNEIIARRYTRADSLYKIAIDSIPVPDKYGVAFALHYGAGKMKSQKGEDTQAIEYFMKACNESSRKTDLLAWAYYEIAASAKKLKNNSLFEWACFQAINADEINGNANSMKELIDKLKNNKN